MNTEQMREALQCCIAALERVHHATEADRLAAADKARAVLASLNQEPARVGGVPMTDERIDHIADLVVKGMPDGIQGFLKSWGWRQFARAILADCAGHYAAPQAPADVVRDIKWVKEMIDDTREVFDASGPETPQVVRDVIEYVKSWAEVYLQKRLDAAMSTKAGGV